jgi:hypothetical protein
MGSKLARLVLGPRLAHLHPRAARLFAYMALTAKDQDQPPRYYGGHDALVECLYGKTSSDPRHKQWQSREVYRVLDVLKTAGCIQSLKDGHRGTRAEYILLVNPNLMPGDDTQALEGVMPGDSSHIAWGSPSHSLGVSLTMPGSETQPNNKDFKSFQAIPRDGGAALSGRGGAPSPVGANLSSGSEHDSPESETSPRQHSDSDDDGIWDKPKTPRREPRPYAQRPAPKAKAKTPKTGPLEEFRSAYPLPFKPTTAIVKAWDQATTRADVALIIKGATNFAKRCADDDDDDDIDLPDVFLSKNYWALFLDLAESEAIGYCDDCSNIVPHQGHAPDCATQYKRGREHS